jgi:hypothetical protein
MAEPGNMAEEAIACIMLNKPSVPEASLSSAFVVGRSQYVAEQAKDG